MWNARSVISDLTLGTKQTLWAAWHLLNVSTEACNTLKGHCQHVILYCSLFVMLFIYLGVNGKVLEVLTRDYNLFLILIYYNQFSTWRSSMCRKIQQQCFLQEIKSDEMFLTVWARNIRMQGSLNVIKLLGKSKKTQSLEAQQQTNENTSHGNQTQDPTAVKQQSWTLQNTSWGKCLITCRHLKSERKYTESHDRPPLQDKNPWSQRLLVAAEAWLKAATMLLQLRVRRNSSWGDWEWKTAKTKSADNICGHLCWTRAAAHYAFTTLLLVGDWDSK